MNFQMYTFNSHVDVFFSNEILEKIESLRELVVGVN